MHSLEYRTGKVPRCTAFANRLPREIYTNRYDHTKGFQGDQGIHFVPREERDVSWQQKIVGALDGEVGIAAYPLNEWERFLVDFLPWPFNDA